MAGKPGMKGGGGARPGAGRPKKVVPPVEIAESDPKAFLMGVVADVSIDPRIRIDAAKALLPYLHPKVGEGGKKDARANAAKRVGEGKFAPAAPPLKLVRG